MGAGCVLSVNLLLPQNGTEPVRDNDLHWVDLGFF